MFNDIYSLKNSFGTSFGLKGTIERIDDSLDDHKLVLVIDDFHKEYISDDEAKQIFEFVTRAFILGSKAEHKYYGATYEFDSENLIVIEHIDKENRGKW